MDNSKPRSIRAQRILQLHAAGYSAREIAETLGVKKSGVFTCVSAWRARARVKRMEHVVDMLAECLVHMRAITRMSKGTIAARIAEVKEEIGEGDEITKALLKTANDGQGKTYL